MEKNKVLLVITNIADIILGINFQSEWVVCTFFDANLHANKIMNRYQINRALSCIVATEGEEDKREDERNKIQEYSKKIIKDLNNLKIDDYDRIEDVLGEIINFKYNEVIFLVFSQIDQPTFVIYGNVDDIVEDIEDELSKMTTALAEARRTKK